MELNNKDILSLKASVSLGYYNTLDDLVHTLKEPDEELELLRAFKCI